MNFVAGLLTLLVISPAFAQTPPLTATISSLSTTQYRRGSRTYEMRIGGSFELENQSKRTVLVSKKVDMVLAVVGALSADAARHGKYVFTMNQEFGGSAGGTPARLEDFMALKPGGRGTVEMDAVLPAEKTSAHPQNDHLRPGKYWFQFEFSTLPLSFPANIDAWREKWRSVGILTAGPFVTQPFPMDIVLDDNAKACDSR